MSSTDTSLVLKLIDKFSAPANEARAALSKIQNTAGDLKNFVKLKHETLATAAAYETAQLEVNLLAKKMKEAAKPSKKLTSEFDKAKKQAGLLKNKLRDQNTTLIKLRSSLKNAGVNTRKLGSEQKRLGNEAEMLSRKLKRLEKVQGLLKSTSSGIKHFSTASLSILKGVGSGFAVITALATATGLAVNKLMIGTAASFEKYKVQLESLEGSSEKAKKAMDWVADFAKDTPFQVKGVMNAFVRLRSFGLNPMDGAMQAIADQTAKLGGGQQELEGIILAVGKAWSKGKLQGEEAQMMIERGVPVWQLLADATGKTTEEIQALSQKGLLGRKSIKLLLDEMQRSSNGAAAKQMKTWNGMVSNLQDSWTRFVNLIAEEGAFDAIKGKLEQILKLVEEGFKNGELQKNAKQIGGYIVATVEYLWVLGKSTIAIFQAIKAIINVIIAPIEKLLSLLESVGNKIHSLLPQNVSNNIGRGVAALMAGLGSKEAKQALNTEADQAGINQKTQVGGTIDIVITQEGKAKVKSMRSYNDDINLDVYTGRSMGNAL